MGTVVNSSFISLFFFSPLPHFCESMQNSLGRSLIKYPAIQKDYRETGEEDRNGVKYNSSSLSNQAVNNRNWVVGCGGCLHSKLLAGYYLCHELQKETEETDSAAVIASAWNSRINSSLTNHYTAYPLQCGSASLWLCLVRPLITFDIHTKRHTWMLFSHIL